MAELEVDQSNLPRVQEVSQYFSVLEDGALAHNLQEQEIEQYYSSNVQRNQLVQKDIRVAKKLQNEEQRRAQMLHEQATRQLEQQDLEYAQRIQEEIQRTAEEERRREEKDQEIAKQIQEEEVLYVRQRNSCRRTDVRDYESGQCEHRRSHNRDNVEHRRQSGHELPLRRRSGQSRSSYASQSSSATGHRLGGWGDVVRLIKNDMSEQGYLNYSSEEELFEPIYKLDSMMSRRRHRSQRCSIQGTRLSHHSSMREPNSRMWQEDQAGGYRHSDDQDSESVRSGNRQLRYLSSGYCTSGDGQRRVRFQDDQRRRKVYSDGIGAFVEYNCGRRELRGCPLKPCEDNVQVDERTSIGEVNRSHRHQQGNEMRNFWSQSIREEEGSCRVQAQHRLRAQSLREKWRYDGENRQYSGQPSMRHVRSERWQHNQKDRLSTEEEEREVNRESGRRRVETRASRPPQLSLSATGRGHSPGAGQTENVSSLDLCELRQVLQDEELAHRLQAEEEELLRGDLASASPLESSYTRGDFTVAQVAQDEEIARFMQKQEMKAQLRSQELENGSFGYGEMSHVYDGTEVYDGQPTFCMCRQQQSFRNIAEQLDPTFQRKENVQTEQSTTGACQIQTTPQAGSCKEPAFVTATKRQNDKVVRAKSKKENSKSKENCKQQ
ncbi:Coiled-coil domain-containing protein 50 [Bagarius yarrelli]|uniref:Coiled-coil domain-containing protein 50 n=1 Tax=Bagarius yarrelli TaxID=175774 RepID=A0A556V1N9_BAGYA|nr:Coiled-coil domain-containing protein 50 [Bagarius yarrelli]